MKIEITLTREELEDAVCNYLDKKFTGYEYAWTDNGLPKKLNLNMYKEPTKEKK